MRIATMVLLIASASSAASAQTVSPILNECGKKCSGTFTIQSNVLIPMAVTVEPYSFSLDKAGKHLRPLDSTTHVKLSETSARLGPKETHEFSYKIICDSLPCSVAFLSGMIVGHTQVSQDNPVLAIRLILDHSVYACARQKNCRKSIIAASGYTGPTATTPKEQASATAK